MFQRGLNLIVQAIDKMHPLPSDYKTLPNTAQRVWDCWMNKVQGNGFN